MNGLMELYYALTESDFVIVFISAVQQMLSFSVMFL